MGSEGQQDIEMSILTALLKGKNLVLLLFSNVFYLILKCSFKNHAVSMFSFHFCVL